MLKIFSSVYEAGYLFIFPRMNILDSVFSVCKVTSLVMLVD